ncbi:hypothetical protein C8J43_10335 [Sphingomonas sp. PP-CE-1G-424]|nr:hypothetical protein C8J43_10335 [Sphingomonas sp. PP-CE-1G-424]
MAVHGVDDARVHYFAALAVLAVHDLGSHWSPAGNGVVASARCCVPVAFPLSGVRHISVHNAAWLRRNQPSMASPLLLEMRQKPYDELGLLWEGNRNSGFRRRTRKSCRSIEMRQRGQRIRPCGSPIIFASGKPPRIVLDKKDRVSHSFICIIEVVVHDDAVGEVIRCVKGQSLVGYRLKQAPSAFLCDHKERSISNLNRPSAVADKAALNRTTSGPISAARLSGESVPDKNATIEPCCIPQGCTLRPTSAIGN